MTPPTEPLSLSDYWKTPSNNVLFVGAYDCRYRFERLTPTPVLGDARQIQRAKADQAG